MQSLFGGVNISAHGHFVLHYAMHGHGSEFSAAAKFGPQCPGPKITEMSMQRTSGDLQYHSILPFGTL